MEDRKRYDALWAEVLLSQGADCLELRTRALALAPRLPSGPPQQKTSSQPSAREPAVAVELPFKILCCRHRSASKAMLYPLFSLDQLFVQAICTQPVLLRKVQKWAAASRGLFPCQLPEDRSVKFHHFTELDRDGGLDVTGEYKWCRLKSVPRAVEKVIRAYGLDVSRLVDVCRQVQFK